MPDSRATPSPSPTSSPTTTSTTATEHEERRGAGISLIQICGGALAAVTAAVAASFLGVAGTLIGAAVGSVISTLAAAVYSTSLGHAARASRTLVVRRVIAPDGAGGTEPASVPASVVPATPGDDEPAPENGSQTDEPAPENGSQTDEPVWRRLRWKPVAIAAGVVFVVAMAVVSISELALGHPLSNSRGSGITLTDLTGSSGQSPTTTPPSGGPTTTPTGTLGASPTGTPTTSPTGATPTSQAPGATPPGSPGGGVTTSTSTSAGAPQPSGSR